MNRRNFIKGFLSATAVVALAPLAPVIELPVQKATFESVVAVTLNRYRSIMDENIYRARFKWESLYAAHCIKSEPSSKALVEPILYV